MHEKKWLAEQFEANRAHLRAVAYRMLGSRAEADDDVQETWLRLGGSDTSAVENLKGWLTTVVARLCLDMLRSRKARREERQPKRKEQRLSQARMTLSTARSSRIQSDWRCWWCSKSWPPPNGWLLCCTT